jgi:hypothetical protein
MAIGINQVVGVLHVSSQRRRPVDCAPRTDLRIQSVAGSSAWMIGFSKTFTSTKMVRMNRTSASFTIVRTSAHAGREYRVSRTPVLALQQIQRVVPAIVVEQALLAWCRARHASERRRGCGARRRGRGTRRRV